LKKTLKEINRSLDLNLESTTKLNISELQNNEQKESTLKVKSKSTKESFFEK